MALLKGRANDDKVRYTFGFDSRSPIQLCFNATVTARQRRPERLPLAPDPGGNLKPAKDKSTERIDGIVAPIMAIGRAMVAEREPQPAYSMFLCLSRAATPPKPQELRRRLPYVRPDGYSSLGTFLVVSQPSIVQA